MNSASHKKNGLKLFPDFLTARAASLIIIGALLCTLLAKLYWAIHTNRLGQYPGWIAADVVVLAAIELFCVLVCFFWRHNWVVRSTLVFAALVCTWSVINAGWLIATGTQVLPAVLLPLISAPLSRLLIVGHHLALRPFAAVALLAPSAVALAFFFYILAKPVVPKLTKKHIQIRLIVYIILLIASAVAAKVSQENIETEAFAELRYNSQFKAIKSILANILRDQEQKVSPDQIKRLPLAEEKQVPLQHQRFAGKFNLVIVVLEGISPGQTNLFNKDGANVPFLAALANSGAAFTNCRTIATHTTKALFAIHTGRYPSISQDYVEAAVKSKPYQSIATILKDCCNYRTAFFQSADGTFEARPGLVHNLGYDKFFARQDITDTNCYLGYLAADEFELIEPVCRWIKQSEEPFMLTILGSATHDPYELPAWYKPAANARNNKLVKKYRSAVEYTDSFLAALYKRLTEVTDEEKIVFCVIGDHGEAFGQHSTYGHARIPYDEALKVFWFIKSELIEKPVKIDCPVSGIDVTPTLLSLLGFDTKGQGFDGIDAITAEATDATLRSSDSLRSTSRNLFFSTWMNNGPAGFAIGPKKFIYDPTNEMIIEFDLSKDPDESGGKFILKKNTKDYARLISEILRWQKERFINLQPDSVEKYHRVFENWLCQTNSRKPRAVYDKR
jgi:phosphoglycerol transferase MdoB-like AlkP superfamily enzyme